MLFTTVFSWAAPAAQVQNLNSVFNSPLIHFKAPVKGNTPSIINPAYRISQVKRESGYHIQFYIAIHPERWNRIANNAILTLHKGRRRGGAIWEINRTTLSSNKSVLTFPSSLICDSPDSLFAYNRTFTANLGNENTVWQVTCQKGSWYNWKLLKTPMESVPLPRLD